MAGSQNSFAGSNQSGVEEATANATQSFVRRFAGAGPPFCELYPLQEPPFVLRVCRKHCPHVHVLIPESGLEPWAKAVARLNPFILDHTVLQAFPLS